MHTKSLTQSSLFEENADLRARLTEAEEMLRAIRSGDTDALVVESAAGPQVYVLQGLDAEVNRVRGTMLAQVSDAVIAVDSEERIVYLNAAAERLYDVAAPRVLGRELSDVVETRWLHPEDEAIAKAALCRHGKWRGEEIHIRRDGSEMLVEVSFTVVRAIGGQPLSMLFVIRDVTERKRHEDKVLVSEIRYRRIFEAAHDGILLLDPDTRKIIDANPFMTQMLGYPRDQLVGKELFEIGLLKDMVANQEMFAKLKVAGHVRYENLPFESDDGKHQDVEVVSNLYDENGHSVIQCNVRDITERKRNEAHVKLLMAEVNHRAKNLLAVVQGVALQTAKHGDPATIAARLSERIGGLATGQDLLVKNQWRGIDVSDLVEAQLVHFKDLIGTRVLIDGPPARLTPPAAQGIGMALHELATNAAKYGALSNREGRVRVVWHITSAPKPLFSMSWLEDGGPKVAAPTRTGFGRIVVGRMAEAAVQGATTITFEEKGLSWNLIAPVENALTSADTGDAAYDCPHDDTL